MARNKTAKEMTALEIESVILRQIDLIGLEEIADFVGVDNTTISKWKDKDKSKFIINCSRLLYAAGLKVVLQDDVFVDMEHLETVFDLAGKGLLAEKERILGQ